MPFGKHRGKTLGDIARREPSYLLWLLDRATTLSGAFREAVRAVLFWPDAYARGFHDGRQVEAMTKGRREAIPDRDRLAASVKTWHRKAAIELHPDRLGGNAKAMALVNALRDQLLYAIEVCQ